MTFIDKARGAPDLKTLLEALIPGKHSDFEQVRSQILSFARNPIAKHILLLGPIGSGNSTIARAIALGRYLYFCGESKFREVVGKLRFDGPFRIDKRLLDFYEEMHLTGLVSQIAQAQLFGVAEKAATGVSERPGIFEQAMRGHSPKGRETTAAGITNGVVLLDEVGDLSQELQPLLLPVLSGTEVFRVGGEGNRAYAYTYSGTVIAATWKEITTKPTGDPSIAFIRADLLSRLSSYVIRLPRLNERRDEFDEIVPEIVFDFDRRHKERLQELKRFDVVDKGRIESELKRTIKIDKKMIDFLRSQDWDQLGDLRGLTQVLERSFCDNVPIGEALDRTASLSSTDSNPKSDALVTVVDEILQDRDAKTITDALNRRDKRFRKAIVRALRKDSVQLSRVAEKFGIRTGNLKKQLNNLTRDRSKAKYEID